MPRSGTTLVEQILASSPRRPRRRQAARLRRRFTVWAEPPTCARLAKPISPVFPRAARVGLRITDKLPANFLHARLIHGALPNARIIHVTRDPADTCVSCFSKLFDVGRSSPTILPNWARYRGLPPADGNMARDSAVARLHRSLLRDVGRRSRRRNPASPGILRPPHGTPPVLPSTKPRAWCKPPAQPRSANPFMQAPSAGRAR